MSKTERPTLESPRKHESAIGKKPEAWLASGMLFEQNEQAKTALEAISEAIAQEGGLSTRSSERIRALVELIVQAEADLGKQRIALRHASLQVLQALGYEDRLAESISRKYLLTEAVGKGGAAEVYAARSVVDPTGHEDVVKIVGGRMVRDASGEAKNFVTPVFAEMLKDEMKQMAKVRHQNVVPIYFGELIETEQSYGEVEIEGWYAMPKIEGGDLESFSRDASGEPRPLATEEGIELAVQIADAVAAIHEAGVVHNDLKPANIFVQQHEGQLRAMVGDFGLARMILEQTHSVIAGFDQDRFGQGTPGYAAPEQVTSKYDLDDPHSIERFIPKRDIFAMGAMFYRFFAGKEAFKEQGEGYYRVLERVLQDERQGLASLRPDLPPELARLVDRMLDRDPSQRPDSGEVAMQLKHIRLIAKSEQARKQLLAQWPEVESTQPQPKRREVSPTQSSQSKPSLIARGRQFLRKLLGRTETTQPILTQKSDPAQPVEEVRDQAPEVLIPPTVDPQDLLDDLEASLDREHPKTESPVKETTWPKDKEAQRLLIRDAVNYAQELSLEDLEQQMGVSRSRLAPRLAELIRDGVLLRDPETKRYRRRDLQTEILDVLHEMLSAKVPAQRVSVHDLMDELDLSKDRAADILAALNEQGIGTFSNTEQTWLAFSQEAKAYPAQALEEFFYMA